MAIDHRYLERISILLVDPNEFMRGLVRHVLHKFGCAKIVEAGDGVDALQALKAFDHDILITEWRMEPIDGIELTRMIRTAGDSRNPYLPIILTTAYSEIDKVMTARDAGITEFVSKPLSALTLIRHIVETIERPRPFVKAGPYFGPDRRRRTRLGFEGDDRRAPPPSVIEPSDLSQEEIDAVVAGDALDPNEGGS